LNEVNLKLAAETITGVGRCISRERQSKMEEAAMFLNISERCPVGISTGTPTIISF
jgi:hypothetical protein